MNNYPIFETFEFMLYPILFLSLLYLIGSIGHYWLTKKRKENDWYDFNE